MTRAAIAQHCTLAITWALHVVVTVVAVFSLLANMFPVWADMRFMGIVELPAKIIWAVSALAVVYFAGPRLKKKSWVRGSSRTWAGVALIPTYLMMILLAANLVQFLRFWWQDCADDVCPLQVPALLTLAAWVFLTRRYLRGALPADLPHRGMAVRGVGAAFGIAVVALMAGVSWIYNFSRPVPLDGYADAAVVLGTGLRDNGSATEDLADRVKVAIRLYQQKRVGKIVLSGAVWLPEYARGRARNEVGAMRQECLIAGIPDEALVLDPVGFNTRATALHTITWMQQNGYRSVVLCTSPSHLFRTARAFEEYAPKEFTLYAMPAVATHFPTPHVKGLLRELVGNVVYAFSPQYREPKVMTMQLSSPRVVVKKKEGILQLFDGTALKKTYTCTSGGNAGDKNIEGDRKTPEGTFRIVYKNPLSQYHLSLGLDYPNKEDAARGLAERLITQAEYDGILSALSSDLTLAENQKKLWYTKLGGEIFIHGQGEGRTGTAGCIAVSNRDVEELYAILPLGTEVVISP